MLKFQMLKDTFYSVLRDRIAAANPARTIVLRQQLRPAVLVVENELAVAAVDGIATAETFYLGWSGLTVDTQGPLPLLRYTCEIACASDGTEAFGGMDRGRALSAMDAELANAISTLPQSANALWFSEAADGTGVSVTDLGTNIFWSDLVFLPVTTKGGRMERRATLEVFGYGQ